MVNGAALLTPGGLESQSPGLQLRTVMAAAGDEDAEAGDEVEPATRSSAPPAGALPRWRGSSEPPSAASRSRLPPDLLQRSRCPARAEIGGAEMSNGQFRTPRGSAGRIRLRRADWRPGMRSAARRPAAEE
ncbi:unnamed protein product [Urochloa humidicola]